MREAALIETCDFCDIIEGRTSAQVVFENETVLALFPLEPAAPGHTLVIPKTHVRDFLALDTGLASDMALCAVHVGRALRDVLTPDGMNLITSAGEAATQTVFHLHYHLVPRWTGDRIGDIWPPGQAVHERLNDQLVELIRCQASDSGA